VNVGGVAVVASTVHARTDDEARKEFAHADVGVVAAVARQATFDVYEHEPESESESGAAHRQSVVFVCVVVVAGIPVSAGQVRLQLVDGGILHATVARWMIGGRRTRRMEKWLVRGHTPLTWQQDWMGGSVEGSTVAVVGAVIVVVPLPLPYVAA